MVFVQLMQNDKFKLRRRMSGKFGYYAGLALGLVIVYGLYVLGIYGVFQYLLNGEIPYAPIILLIAVFSARRVVQTQLYLDFLVKTDAKRQRLANIDSVTKRMMTKVAESGRNN